MEIFTVSGLTFTYPGQAGKALDNLSFSVARGEFVTLAGLSGCGKTTLLRHLKPALAPHGSVSGEILFEGRPLSGLDRREQSARIGFVMQNPESQIVTDKVWHELAFGLESLGFATPAIRGRVAEMAGFFGIEDWFYKDVAELSGGQKQLLNLASIMAMQPSALLLDEPTGRLDPVAAADFLAALGRINRELGTTVIIAEHRLEEVLPMSDRVLVMDGGKLVCHGPPREAGEMLKGSGHAMFFAMPVPMRVYAAVPNGQKCPVTVRDGRLWLDEFAREHTLAAVPAGQADDALPRPQNSVPAVSLCDLWFRYEKGSPDVLRGLSAKAYKGELFAILGGNGSGKTTLLSLIAGIHKPYRGSVLLFGKEVSGKSGPPRGLLGVLPQNPQALFVKNTVREDLLEILKEKELPEAERDKKIAFVSRLCRLEGLLARHPYDLSGGEQQRAALAKVLLSEPEILLLDEPTKGLDAAFRRVFAEILQSLLRRGVTIIMVSHDIEFCAEYAHRCAMLFGGDIVTEGVPRAFFSGNSFYTTAANRMARHLLPGAVTAGDVIRACGGNMPDRPELPEDGGGFFTEPESEPEPETGPEAEPEPGPEPEKRGKKQAKRPLWRKIIAGAAGAAALAAFFHGAGLMRLTGTFGAGYGVYIALLSALLVLALAAGRRSGRPPGNGQAAGKGKRKLPKRTVAAAAMILLAIPLTICVGMFYLGDRKYAVISLFVIFETMLPFVLVFESRKPRARELVVIAVLCALGVAGRAAFFMLPECKPVTAVVILSGVAFGGETGFLVGAVTMLVSNIMFSQGPWTPWQMFAMGVVGFLAGVLFRKGFLRRSRASLSLFGGLSAVMIYGGIMNPAAAIMWQSRVNWQMILAYYVTGLPMDLVHAASTAFFLWFLSQPMLEKLDRIKMKYGLVEA